MATGQKVAIVTGAASGLGRAMALGLAGSGMHVVAVDRDGPALGKLQAPSGGGSIMPLPADLTQPDVFERIPAVAVKEFGRIDVLVNNAGIAPVPPSLLGVSEELFDKTFGVNLNLASG